MADLEGLNPDFAQRIQKLIELSGGKIWINSGYRSVERQAQLYQSAIQQHGEAQAGKWVAPPGKSNHNFGLAVDLGGDMELAHQLAPQVGLVFPMSWEPWHVEPPYARAERGAQWKEAYTTPPTSADGTVPEPTAADPYGSLANQMYVFTQILNGVDPHDIHAEFFGANQTQTTAAGGDHTGEPSDGALPQGNVDPSQVYNALVQHGVDPPHAAALTAVAARESGYKVAAYNPNRATGDDSHGLFQINLLNGGWGPTLKDKGVDPGQLGTLEGSTAGAKVLLDASGGKMTPWGPYKGQKWYYNVPRSALETAAQLAGISVDQLMAVQ